DVTRCRRRHLYAQIPTVAAAVETADSPDAVNVTLDDVPAESGVRAHRPLEVQERSAFNSAQCGPIERLSREVGGESVCRKGTHRQAYGVDGNARTDCKVLHDFVRLYADRAEITRFAGFNNPSDFFNYSGEHIP